MKKSEIAEKIKQSGFVPVFNHDDLDTSKRVIKACYDAGLRVFEWTNRSEKAFEVFSELVKYVGSEMPDMSIGVGSIFNGDMAHRYALKGACFVVSPILEPELAERCKQLELLWIPGAGTATEIHQALKWGADIVKIFPGDAAGGPSFIKAVLGPMRKVNLMPTGGVKPERENLEAWFKAGVCCVGMGSKLFSKELVEDEDSSGLVEKIRETLVMIQDVRRKT